MNSSVPAPVESSNWTGEKAHSFLPSRPTLLVRDWLQSCLHQ